MWRRYSVPVWYTGLGRVGTLSGLFPAVSRASVPRCVSGRSSTADGMKVGFESAKFDADLMNSNTNIGSNFFSPVHSGQL